MASGTPLKGLCIRCKDWTYIRMLQGRHLCGPCKHKVEFMLKYGRHCEKCGYNKLNCICREDKIK